MKYSQIGRCAIALQKSSVDRPIHLEKLGSIDIMMMMHDYDMHTIA
jgi:hypothetical protein